MIELAAAVQDLPGDLNALDMSDLVFWSEAELYDQAEEAARRLGRAGLFVRRDPIPTLAASPGYQLPAETLAIVHVSIDGASLRPINVQELEALDTAWRAGTAGTVSYWAADVSGVGSLYFYRAPAAPGSATVVRHAVPVTASGAQERASLVFADALHFDVLAAARRRDGSGRMPDAAETAVLLTGIYADLFARSWEGA